jgi:hypothetical protein
MRKLLLVCSSQPSSVGSMLLVWSYLPLNHFGFHINNIMRNIVLIRSLYVLLSTSTYYLVLASICSLFPLLHNDKLEEVY